MGDGASERSLPGVDLVQAGIFPPGAENLPPPARLRAVEEIVSHLLERIDRNSDRIEAEHDRVTKALAAAEIVQGGAQGPAPRPRRRRRCPPDWRVIAGGLGVLVVACAPLVAHHVRAHDAARPRCRTGQCQDARGESIGS